MKVQLLTVTSHYYTVTHNYPASKLYCNYPNWYTKTCCVQRTLYMPPSIVTQKLVVSKEHYICPNQLFHKNLMCPKNTMYAPINCYTKTWCVQRTLYMPPSIVTQKLVSKEHYICPNQLIHKNLLCVQRILYAPINCYTQTCCVQRTLYAPINCSTKTCVQRTLYMPPSIVPQKLVVSKEHYMPPSNNMVDYIHLYHDQSSYHTCMMAIGSTDSEELPYVHNGLTNDLIGVAFTWWNSWKSTTRTLII